MITAQMAPDNYFTMVETGGDIEEKYLEMGQYEVKCFEVDYVESEDINKIKIYYPANLETEDAKYPVVMFVNGTGVGASRYQPVFKHLASWGFIAIGNEDPSSWEGKKANATIEYLLRANEDVSSVFYDKIDLENIGVTGHSQGGVGGYNTINDTDYKNLYKCAVSLSPTEEEMATAIGIPYDPSETTIPIFMLCGTNSDVISPKGMISSFDKVTASKVMAVRKNASHGEMLYSADGYVTAWFMWRLMGDELAANAFIGEKPEIKVNDLYQNQNSAIY